MGEVYRGRDTRLERDVALKVLPASLANDPDRLHRLELEARAAGQINHPNVVAIYDVASVDGRTCVVEELLEGESLGHRLARGGIPPAQVIRYATQIAEGLAAAHRRGIVHRDLKPDNIFITTDEDRAKILDFGLAKTLEPFGADASTVTRATMPGAVMGTVGYMAPEQVRGEPADHRSDIFSFGVVLFEMLSGRRAFARGGAAETLAAILNEEPPHLGSETIPTALAGVLRRCLAKNPDARFQSARDLAFHLEQLSSGAVPSLPSPAPRGALLRWGVVVLAVAASIGLATRLGRPGSAAVTSLAVLPFENATRAADTEFLSDGISEGLINSLSRLPGVRVVARTTAFTYKGKTLDLDRIRRDLDVDAILTGRVTSQNGGLTVQADLIHVGTKAQLWGDRYQQAVADPLTIEDQIIAGVMNRLNVPRAHQEKVRIGAERTGSKAAYALYLRGRHEQGRRSPEGMAKARAYFQQAIDSDPTFAAAYAGLADTYILMGGILRLLPKEEAHALGTAAARRALELDPAMAEAHASLGLIAQNEFRWKSAEKELRRAIELNPNYAPAHQWYSLVLNVTGRTDEALQEMRQASRLDPLSPNIAANVARALNHSGDYAGALREAKKAIDLNPDFPYGYWQLGMAYEHQGHHQLAAQTYERMLQTPGPAHIARAALGRSYSKLGRTAEARAIAAELEAQAATGQVAPTHAAWVYSALGENDRAFYWLERALATRDVALRDSIRAAMLMELRDDPRYDDLLRRLLSVEQ